MGMGRWCSSCTRVVSVEHTDLGLICCTRCGKVLEEDIYSTEATFTKDQAGRSQRAGNIVNTIERESRERTLDKAYDTIIDIAESLGVGGGDQVCLPAKRFYAMALEKNFTRGRRADQVAAACLYIACRVNEKPFLLIEFSEILGVNVYVLGAVFLQLCKLLRLSEHPVVQKPVDPSLFIRRFSNGLLGEVNHEVERTALRIIASMKRDWMQTGRKPSGICGAALYISALSHGFKFSKTNVVRIVHICEATLTKRLIEFEETESGCLTIEEFNNEAEKLEKKVEELERSISLGKQFTVGCDMSEKGELLCEHRGSKEPHFAHGLCGPCYIEFMKISGGLDGGSEPPAFQRAEREREAAASACEKATDNLIEPIHGESSGKNLRVQKEARKLDGYSYSNDQSETRTVDGCVDENGKEDNMGTEGESESFSDIDDTEVDGYLHSEEEKRYKKIIWEDLNREYVQEQAAKERAALIEANMSSDQNCPASALELKAVASERSAKAKKERQQKRAADAKCVQTAAEATHQVLTKKRISSKVNYDKLKELLDEPEVFGNPKKNRTEIQQKSNLSQIKENNAEAENNEDEVEAVNEYEWNGYTDDRDNSYFDYEDYEEFDDES